MNGTLTDLQTRLQQAKSAGSVPFDGPTLGTPGTTIAANLLAALNATLTFTAAASIGPGKSTDTLVVSGPLKATVLGIKSPPQVTATFATSTSAKGDVRLDVVITIPAGDDWALAHTFPNLATSSLGQIALKQGAQFVFRSSDLAPDAFGSQEPAGLNLEVAIEANGAGPLGVIAALLKLVSGSTLSLAGPVSTGAKAESVTLRGASGAPNADLPVPGLSPVGLKSTQIVLLGTASLNEDGSTWSTDVGQQAFGLVSIGATPVPFGVAIPSGLAAWRLFVVPGAGVRLLSLLEFIPGLSLLEYLPDQVKTAVNGVVKTFSITLPGSNAASLKLESLQVMVAGTESWELIPGALELKNITVTLAVAWPGAKVTGSVSGVIALDAVEGKEVDISVNVPIPLGGAITIWSNPAVKLPGLGALTTLVGGASLTAELPDGVADIGSFTLNAVAVTIDPSKPAITQASISLGADRWVLIPGDPNPRLAMEGLGIDIAADLTQGTPDITGSFAGTFDIAGQDVALTVGRSQSPGDWEAEVTVQDLALPSLESLAHLAGGSFSDTLPPAIANFSFVLVSLDLKVDLSTRSMERFSLVIGTATPWPVIPGQFEIEQVSASLDLDWTSGALVKSGSLSSVLEFEEAVQLGISATKPRTGGWILAGKLEKPVKLGHLIETGLGFTAPDGLLNLDIDALSLTYDTGTKAYSFAGAASWVPDIPGLELEIDASVAVARVPVTGKTDQFAYSGQIEGDLKSHFGSDTLDLSMAYKFQQPASGGKQINSYVFKLAFNKITLTGTYTTAANGDGIVTLKLGGVTFGDIVGYLVHLVDPSLPATLSSPWDVLNKINFDDLELIVNVTQRTIGIKDTINLDLGIVNVQSITLTYVNKGGSPTVDIAIAGSFLGQDYPEDKPLSWDMLNEDPPATPGAGAALLDLKDLGVGQHLVLAPGAKTMPEILKQMHEVVAGAQDDPKPWQILHFDSQAGWLIGANFTVMGTVTLGIVFNDPVLYGAQITVSGEKAGPFDGLIFQILYRKVSADVGVYHIELQLPTLMRHLEFGEVSITLPNVILDIYTDGGFYIDLGFPYNNDWSVSFGLQIFPFVGAGGFYFGRLTAADGATDLVPQISNGTFGPVIEFGVALALGVGKDISEGPLSAGVSVTVQGIVTGVVAWFNPTDKSISSDRYYKITGSLAIVGKMYGSVDFKVLSVSISITASVTASVVIEAYAPIYLGLSVDVEVEASIKILFIRIHFSFSMHLDASFTIGSQQATPWTLGAPSGTGAGAGAGGAPHALTARRRNEAPAHLLAAAASFHALTATRDPLAWKPAKVLATPQVANVLLVPMFTVAPDPSSGNETVTITMAPSMPTTPPNTTGVPVPIDQVTPQAFDWLIEALVKWGMSTLIGATTGPVTAVDLQLVYEDLADPDISQRGFDYGDLTQFLAANVTFALAAPDLKQATELHGAVLPMPPPLKMKPDGGALVDFSALPAVDDSYQSYVQSILDKLAVNYGYDRAPDPTTNGGGNGVGAQRTLLRGGGEPITEALFADWLLMVAKSSFQAAINELKATHYNVVAPGDSLASIAARIAVPVTFATYAVQADGESATAIAARFGIGTGPLQASNPDADLGNLKKGQTLQVPQGLLYTVRAGDTAASVAHLFGIATAALVAVNGPDVTTGEVLVVPPPMAVADYVTVAGDSLASIAAAWHVDPGAITRANPAGTAFAQPGTPVKIPVPAALFELAAANLSAPLAGAPVALSGLVYSVKAGDSLASIATAFKQTDGGLGIATANAQAKGFLIANGTASIQLAQANGKGAPYTIAGGDTLALIAAYSIVRNLGPAEQSADAWVAAPGLGAPAQADAAWFASAVTAANASAPAAGPWTVPTVVRSANGPLQQTGTLSYVPKAGDSFGLVGGYFALVQLYPDALATAIAAIEAANPGITPTNVPPGTAIALPVVAHTIAVGDTLADLAGRYGLQLSDLVGQQVNANAQILMPNAEIALPAGLAYPVAAGTTLQALASALGLTVDSLVGRVGGIANLFQAQAAVTRPNARQADVDYLLKALVGSGETASVAGMSSHFMLHGLRLPQPPDPKAGAIEAMYAITSQQFPAPPSIAPNTYYDITFTADAGATWVSLPPAGVVVQLDQPTLTAQSPSLTLNPQVQSGPKRDPLFHAAPIAHSVGPQVPWIAPQPPALPGTPPAGGSPSLWRLPPNLLAQVAAGQVPDADYLLGQSPKGKQAPDPPPGVAGWSWATFLPLTVRRVASPAGGWLDGTYMLLGADQTDRDTLLALWTHLLASGDRVQLALAYPAAGGGAGLVSDAFSAADLASRVAIIKSNLSTETHSGPALATAAMSAPPPFTDAYASLAAPRQFLQLAWEASVTGTGGFYLNYTNSAGTGLPASAFPSGEDGQLYVIAVVGDPNSPDRKLRPYTTGAVVAESLDPSKVDVFAYTKTGDTTVVTTAPPGNVAFSLTRTNPDPGTVPSAATRTQSLFSLLAFTLSGTGFQQPPIALPIGPKTTKDAPGIWEYGKTIPVYKLLTTSPPDMADLLPPGSDDPYAGIAKDPKATDPFKGAYVDLGFSFRDVFGNELASTPALGGVHAPVAYYDPLRGLGAWPSASGHYEIAGAAGAAVVTARLDLGLDKYVPSPSNLFAAAVRTAAADQAIYGQVHYQLQQPDVTCSIDTSLDAPGSGSLISGAGAKRPLEAFVMASYLYLGAAQSVRQVEHTVTAGEKLGGVAGDNVVTPSELMTANAAAAVTGLTAGPVAVPHDWAVRSTDTLGGIASATGITVGQLLTNNSAVELRAGAALPTATWTYTTRAANASAKRPADNFTTVAAIQATTIEAVAVANAGNAGILTPDTVVTIATGKVTAQKTDSLSSLVSALAEQGVKTTAADIAKAYANSSLLATGVPIAVANVAATPNDQTGVRTHTVAAGEALGKIAGANNCTLGALALANAQLPGLLTLGAPVEVKGVSVTVGDDGSLLAVIDQLLAAAVLAGTEVVIGVADLAASIETDTTILVDKAKLAIVDYVVQAHDTVTSLETSLPGFTLAQLARLAAPGPAGVYPTGQALRIDTTDYPPQPGDTFTGIAAEFGITVEELAGANAGLALTPGAGLVIPGAVTLGSNVGAALYVPLDASPLPTLADVIKQLGTDGKTLGLANAAMPSLLAPSVDVTYGGKKTTTQPGSTLASVAAAVGAADAGALAADATVAALKGLVAPGALFVASAPPASGRSLGDLASPLAATQTEGALQAACEELATANSAVAGLVADGKPITVKGKEVTAHATDTLASIVRRLAALDGSIGLPDLVAAYKGDTALFAQDARVLLPPPEVQASAGLATPYVPAPFTPLDASVTIARDASLVDPLAADIGPVASDTTPLAPNLGPDGRPDVFASEFETAYSARRLKLATGPEPGDGAKRLWVVDFGAPGISKVQIQPGSPRFYALAPISQQLESGSADIGQYDPATGTLGPTTTKAFASVDVDAWMRMALEAIDLFLSPPVAARAWSVNPTDLTHIVEDKQAIADALTERVDEILDDANPAGLDEAREALRQSMLVSLATAYTTDAVIQFPIDVASPFLPPHETGASAESLQQLATAYGVSPEDVATAFADVPSVLKAGVIVGPNNYPVAAGDTLATVATRGGYTAVTQLPPGLAIFAPNTALDLVPLSRAVGASDTFASLAAFFGTTAGAAATAVQDVPGLLTPGMTVTYGGKQSPPVTATDTLRGVAGSVGATAAQIATEPALVAKAGVLVAGKPVACFSPLNPIPPRLVGKPVAAAYQVPAAGDVASLVKLFAPLSLEALAAAIAPIAGLLTKGAVVGGTYTVGDADTIANVAATVTSGSALALLKGVEAGTITVTGGTLFRAGASIPLGRIMRTPTTDDSFESLAEYFGADPGDVAVANEDTAGVLAAGIAFEHAPKKYTTTGSETLAYVAQQLGYASVGDFASDPAVVVRTAIFNTATTLYGVQAMPDFSLSTLKVPLENGTQFASFLFSTSADARFRSLFLDLDLKVDELEFKIEDVPGALGYQGSDWLRFALPLEHKALDGAVQLDALQTDVPIALRSYPQLPLVRALEAAPTWGSEAWPVATIAEGKQWQLEAFVDHQASAQDEMQLEVSFGSPKDAVAPTAAPDALLAPLAQFAVAWPEMQHDVAALSALAPGAADARLGAMVGTFASMVRALATQLRPHGFGRFAVALEEKYEFKLDTTYDSTDEYVESVEVSLVSGPSGNVPWPAIFVAVGDEYKPLRAGGVVGDRSQRYYYPPLVQAFTGLTHRFVFPGSAIPPPDGTRPPAGRDAVQWQHGQVLVSILRNALLVPGAATNPSFIYQTPWIGFTNPAVPLLQSDADIAVGSGPDITAGLTAALQQMLGTDPDTAYQFRVLCRFERQLAVAVSSNGASPGQLVSPLPIFYVPLEKQKPTYIPTFAALAEAQVSAWITATEIVPAAGDAFVFDISVYANDDTQLIRPLVELSRLSVPMPDRHG